MIFYNNINPKDFSRYIIAQNIIQREDKASEILHKAVTDFHADLDLFPQDFESLRRKLLNGAPIIRIAHQPNFLPYSNLILQLRFLQETYENLRSHGQDCVPIIFFVDHDVADASWFSGSACWNSSKKNEVEWFKYPVKDKNGFIFDQEIISTQDVDLIINSISNYGNFIKSRIKGLQFDEIWSSKIREYIFPIHNPKSTAASTGYAWAKLSYSNLIAPDVLFLRSSYFIKELREFYLDLAKIIGNDARNKCQLWTRCRLCYGRSQVVNSNSTLGSVCINLKCKNSNSYIDIDEEDIIIPKVIIDDLTDANFFNAIGGTSYGSSIVHIKETQKVASALKLRFTPEAVWRMCPPMGKEIQNYIENFYSKREVPSIVNKIVFNGRVGLPHYLLFKNELNNLLEFFNRELMTLS